MSDERKLAVEITEQKSISTVHFEGTYDPLSIILMKEMINALIRNKRLKLILEFGQLDSLDPSAYDYFAEVQKEVSRLGGAVVIVCPPSEPKDICDKLKQKYGFLMFPSFEEARDYFIGREF